MAIGKGFEMAPGELERYQAHQEFNLKLISTRIGWMEKRELCTSQWSCPECEQIFHYLNDTDDTVAPKFCPECGRKNLRAAGEKS